LSSASVVGKVVAEVIGGYKKSGDDAGAANTKVPSIGGAGNKKQAVAPT